MKVLLLQTFLKCPLILADISRDNSDKANLLHHGDMIYYRCLIMEAILLDDHRLSFFLHISQVITHHFDIKDYKKGFETMISGESGKVILDWTNIQI